MNGTKVRSATRGLKIALSGASLNEAETDRTSLHVSLHAFYRSTYLSYMHTGIIQSLSNAQREIRKFKDVEWQTEWENQEQTGAPLLSRAGLKTFFQATETSPAIKHETRGTWVVDCGPVRSWALCGIPSKIFS